MSPERKRERNYWIERLCNDPSAFDVPAEVLTRHPILRELLKDRNRGSRMRYSRFPSASSAGSGHGWNEDARRRLQLAAILLAQDAKLYLK